MTEWVRAGRWDLCLDDIGMVERRDDGTVRVYLRRGREVTLTAAEADTFLAHFGRFTGLDGDGSVSDDD